MARKGIKIYDLIRSHNLRNPAPLGCADSELQDKIMIPHLGNKVNQKLGELIEYFMYHIMRF